MGSLAQKPGWSGLRSESEKMGTVVGGQQVKEVEGIGTKGTPSY